MAREAACLRNSLVYSAAGLRFRSPEAQYMVPDFEHEPKYSQLQDLMMAMLLSVVVVAMEVIPGPSELLLVIWQPSIHSNILASIVLTIMKVIRTFEIMVSLAVLS